MTTIAAFLDSFAALLVSMVADMADQPEWMIAWTLEKPELRSDFAEEWVHMVADARTLLTNRADMESRGFHAGTDAEWEELKQITSNPFGWWTDTNGLAY